MREAVAKHKQEYGVVWLSAMMAALTAIAVNLGSWYQMVDSIATEAEVVVIAHEIVSTYERETDERLHAFEESISKNSEKLDLILINQTRSELDKLTGYRCDGIEGLDDTIRRLKAEYRRLTNGEMYRSIPCSERQ